jgi:hypothetical protein
LPGEVRGELWTVTGEENGDESPHSKKMGRKR